MPLSTNFDAFGIGRLRNISGVGSYFDKTSTLNAGLIFFMLCGRHECALSGRHLRKLLVAQKEQHDDPSSIRESTKEDLTVTAQSQSEDDEGISPPVLEEKSTQAVHAEVRRL